MSDTEPVLAAGTPITYWGAVAKYSGMKGVIVWANECNCAHQTYCIELQPDGKRLEKVMRGSLYTEEQSNS